MRQGYQLSSRGSSDELIFSVWGIEVKQFAICITLMLAACVSSHEKCAQDAKRPRHILHARIDGGLIGAVAKTNMSRPVVVDQLKRRTIKDCPDCPELVVVPAGSFIMGSPASESHLEAQVRCRSLRRLPSVATQ